MSEERRGLGRGGAMGQGFLVLLTEPRRYLFQTILLDDWVPFWYQWFMANATNPATAFALPADEQCECIECGERHCEPTHHCDVECCNDHSKTWGQVEAEERAAELARERAWDRFQRAHGGLFEALCALKAERDAKAVK